MILRVRGVKAWLVILGILVLALVVIAVFVQVLLFLLPVIILIIVISYLFRILNKLKKEPQKNYRDISFRVKR